MERHSSTICGFEGLIGLGDYKKCALDDCDYYRIRVVVLAKLPQCKMQRYRCHQCHPHYCSCCTTTPSTRPYRHVAAIFPVPTVPDTAVIEWIGNESARALTCVPIAHSIGIRAIVQTGNVLAVLAKVSIPADASRHGILQAAVAVEAAIVFAVLDAAIVSQKWWGALARTKTVANSLGVTGK